MLSWGSGGARNAYRIYVAIPHGNRLAGRTSKRSKDNAKMDRTESCFSFLLWELDRK
jgi:hypothetical protein